MKNVLMTLFFLSGLAVTQVVAQNCAPCPPCPPGCCAEICDANSKACKLDKKARRNASVAVCTPAQLEACKAASVSSSSTESAHAAAYNTTVAAHAPTCTPAVKSAHDVDTKAPARQKNTRLVVSKG